MNMNKEIKRLYHYIFIRTSFIFTIYIYIYIYMYENYLKI